MKTTRRRTRLVALLAALILTTAACSTTATDDRSNAAGPTSDTVTAGASIDRLADLGAEELIAALEATPVAERRTDLLAAIEPRQVVLTIENESRAVPIPDGQHYVSVAPFTNSTHECYYHSLTTCTGELGGQDVTIRAIDAETGEVYLEKPTRLQDNGFTGLWLPADVTVTVIVESSLGSGQATISTGDDDLTCLTDLQLI